MPAALGFKSYPWVERILKVRENPWTAFGSAGGFLLVAAAAGAAIGELVGPRMPFTAFYPAVILSAIVGGLWPGVVAASSPPSSSGSCSSRPTSARPGGRTRSFSSRSSRS